MKENLTLYSIPAVNAALREPVVQEDGPGVLTFFARGYLVWAHDLEEAVQKVTLDIEVDATVLDLDPPEPVDPTCLEEPMRRSALSATSSGVCWRSGRMFYPPE